MARITPYTQQVSIDAPAAPTAAPSNYTSNALVGLGGAISDLGAALKERQDKRDAFMAQDELRQFELKNQRAMEESAANMEPGGVGFHDGFMETYSSNREEMLARIKNPEMRERIAMQTSPGGEGLEGGSIWQKWSNQGATVERDETYRYAGQRAEEITAENMNIVAVSPEAFEETMGAGLEFLDSLPMPKIAREEQKRKYKSALQEGWVDGHLQRGELDKAAKLLNPMQFRASGMKFAVSNGAATELLKRALIQVESSGRADAVSGAGAVGLMQLMPGTAEEIAKELSDVNFPRGNPDLARQYLMDPEVNTRYGTHYLNKMLRRFDGDVAAALVAYNGGPGRAEKWLKSGRDDSVIPSETRAYYKKVLGLLMPNGSINKNGDVVTGFKAPNFTFRWARGGKSETMGIDHPELKALNPDLMNRVAFAAAGMSVSELGINSGRRGHNHNKKVGGAKGSQHLPQEELGGKGNAIDINVAGWSTERKVKFFRALSAAGITGLGYGNNIIHADMGPRRSWTYTNGKPTDNWGDLKEMADAHDRGELTAPGGTAMDPRLDGMDWNTRAKLLKRLDTELRAQEREGRVRDAVARREIERAMDNELALVLNTGEGSPGFAEEEIANLLGAAKYNDFVRAKELNEKLFAATDKLDQLPPAELERAAADYLPVAGSSDYADQQKIHTEVERQVAKIQRQRTNDPFEAAKGFPEVKQAYASISEMMEKFQRGEGVDTQAMEAFIRQTLDAQRNFDIPPDLQAPVSREDAHAIGRMFNDIPTITGKNLREVQYAVAKDYAELEQVYGEFTDEVIRYAMKTYKGLDSDTAERITQMMELIAKGGDPFRKPGAPRDDTDRADSDSFWQTLTSPETLMELSTRPPAMLPGYWLQKLWGEDEKPLSMNRGDPAGATIDAELMGELIRRLETSPEEEGTLRLNYGDRTVNAAMRAIEARK